MISFYACQLTYEKILSQAIRRSPSLRLRPTTGDKLNQTSMIKNKLRLLKDITCDTRLQVE
ncbi:hypothetical protein BLOT_009277 [Blomia tropicalis]|nr:hypothetical protein BLOT_009277 [Blomia tropicalis]